MRADPLASCFALTLLYKRYFNEIILLCGWTLSKFSAPPSLPPPSPLHSKVYCYFIASQTPKSKREENLLVPFVLLSLVVSISPVPIVQVPIYGLAFRIHGKRSGNLGKRVSRCDSRTYRFRTRRARARFALVY